LARGVVLHRTKQRSVEVAIISKCGEIVLNALQRNRVGFDESNLAALAVHAKELHASSLLDVLKYRKGRAWWGGDGEYWPAHAGGDEQGEVLGTDPPLSKARAAIQSLLRDVRSEFTPDHLALAGYSQGGMLAMDVALTRDPPVDRVGIVSSTILASSLPGLRAAGADPPVLVIHGRKDEVVPFQSGERLKRLLEQHGHRVLWHPFGGGHHMPPPAQFDQLASFLGGAPLLQP
jgi:phospholipase/carboxylesterase